MPEIAGGIARRAILVNPPWGAIAFPGIHVGLLKRCLEERGIPCDTAYANLWLLEHLTPAEYFDITEEYIFMGEWLFSGLLFGDVAGADGRGFWDAFRRRFPSAEARFGPGCEERFERFRRETAARFVEDCMRRVDWGAYGVVGFTCTFDQVIASLALAREIKRRWPRTKIVFGGSQMDPPMGLGYHRAFDWIDHVVMGEGEEAFPALVERLLAGAGPWPPGVSRRASGGQIVCDLPPKPVEDLDAYPIPDYRGYFETLDEVCRRRGLVMPRPVLLLETAKGCWWGERSHCVFCSFNDQAIAYRSKSPERVLEEIREQSRRYGTFGFCAVDSIFNKSFFERLLPKLEAWDLEFFFEAKGDLVKDQIEAMARAGVTEFLIGIDSLSTDALKLMRKGGTLLQNLNVLKWARHFGIRTEYNILHRCPGETEAMYDEMASLMPSLHHLEPPRSLRNLQLLRYSPFHERPGEFGISNVRPFDLYGRIFPEGSVDLRETAFVFDADWEAKTVEARCLPRLTAAYDAWVKAHPRARLDLRRGAGYVRVIDSRSGDGRVEVRDLDGWLAEAFLFCGDGVRGSDDVARHLASTVRIDVPDEDLRRGLDGLVDDRLMVRERGRYLALALPERKPLERRSAPTAAAGASAS